MELRIVKSVKNISQIIEETICAEQEENSFFIFNVADVVQKVKLWKRLLPRVEMFYAVKCNDDQNILKVLAAMGVSFDCATKYEIRKMLKLDVEPSRIILAHTTKSFSHIAYAKYMGVEMMTFDNEFELYKIQKLYSKAKLLIRIKCDDKEAHAVLGVKFGCDPDTEAPRLLRIAQKLGLNVVGVSFHVGSGCENFSAYSDAIQEARVVFDLAKNMGFHVSILDIGGGYPGVPESMIKLASVVNNALDEYFTDKSIRIIGEPGRYCCYSAYTSVVQIHSHKVIQQHSIKRNLYYVNDGIYGSFNGVASYGDYYPPRLLKEDTNGSPLYHSTVYGSTMKMLDMLCADVLLPQMKIGDWLVFENMGAYTLSLCTEFNGCPIPRVYPVIDEGTWLFLKGKLGRYMTNNSEKAAHNT